MSKFKCTSSAPGTSIRSGATVKGYWISETRFIMQEVLDDKCHPNHVGGTFPMTGSLWEWKEVK